MRKKYIIVGGVAGGATTATRLRRLDEIAEIVIFEKGSHVSFSNCSLPYYLGDEVSEKDKLIFMCPEAFKKQYNIEARVNSKVTRVDSAKKCVHVYDEVKKTNYTETYDTLILSPGAKPIVPPLQNIDKLPHFTLRNVDDVEKIKTAQTQLKHVTVIGGGFIGIEVAENLAHKGIKVTIVEALPQVMKPFDFEMALFIEKELLDHKIDLLLSKKVVGFETNKVILDDGTSIDTDAAILSIGITPDTEFLEESGINLAKSKHIIVNEYYQTSLDNVYSVGDAILVKNAITGQEMPLALAGPANKQARQVADHIYNLPTCNNGYIGSSVVRVFDLVAANTGINESWIKFHKLQIDYECVYLAPFDRVSIMPGAQPIFFKLIFEKKSGKILGAQAIGKGLVEKRIDSISVAIKAGMTVENLQDLELCYAPPYGTGKDVVNQAGYIASNLLHHRFKQISFTKVKALQEENAQIIDVRSESEIKKGKLNSSKHIPMEEIRSRLSEIDKSKPVYLHCRTGQRSYNVTLVLQSHGYEAYNIAGSYIFMSHYFDTLHRLNGEGLPFDKANFA